MPSKTAPSPPQTADAVYKHQLEMNLHPSLLYLSSQDEVVYGKGGEGALPMLKPGDPCPYEDRAGRRRRQGLVIVGLCCAFLLSIIVALSAYIARGRTSYHPSAATSAPTRPDMVSESYVQIYSARDMVVLGETQIAAYERILAGYSSHYADEALVTTQCILNFQRLSSWARRRKHRSGGNVFNSSDDTGRKLHGMDGYEDLSALEVDFTLTWSSSSSTVSLAEYPSSFLAYMNSKPGKEQTLTDIRSLLGFAAESASNVTVRGHGQPHVFVVTDAPTDAPTFRPTALPTYAPTSKPTLLPSISPTAKPTPGPTMNPTEPIPEVPAETQCCWVSVFAWCLWDC